MHFQCSFDNFRYCSLIGAEVFTTAMPRVVCTRQVNANPDIIAFHVMKIRIDDRAAGCILSCLEVSEQQKSEDCALQFDDDCIVLM